MNISLLPIQQKFLKSEATQQLIGGSAGSSKSFYSRVLSILYASSISNLQVVIMRKHHGEVLGTHFNNSAGSYQDLLKEEIEAGCVTMTFSPPVIKFANGSRIYAMSCQYEQDLQKLLGLEIGLLIIDESTTLTETQIKFIRSRVRVSMNDKMKEELNAFRDKFDIQFALPKMLFATNPLGVSHNWHKKIFVDQCKPNTIFIDNESGLTSEYNPAFLTDNRYLDEEQYAKNLNAMGNKELVKAYLEGDWNVVGGEGAFFSDLWDESIHVITPFKVPDSFYVDRGFDWGDTSPSAVVWFAEANGEEVTLNDGSILHTIPGDLFIILEYVTHQKDNFSKGTKMLAKDIAKKIKSWEETLPFEVNPGPADNSINTNSNGNCIATDMANEGIYWLKSDKSPGSRINGWSMIRARMHNSVTREGPGIFFFDTCRYSITTIPILPRDILKPDDVDTNSDDHSADVIRYRVLNKKVVSKTKRNIPGLV
jgi:hypothetical protein